MRVDVYHAGRYSVRLGVRRSPALRGVSAHPAQKNSRGPFQPRIEQRPVKGETKRAPDTLTSKGSANYSSAVDEREQTYTTCRYYIPDKNCDGLGACSVVKGYIELGAWCTLYAPYQETPA